MKNLFTTVFAITFLLTKAQEITIPIEEGVLSAELTEVNKNYLIISIAGSGPTDRDGNNPQMKNNSLKMLSDSLVSKGFSTLRIDKRGVGKSTITNMKEENLSFDTFVNDLSKWTNAMKEKGFKRIYLMGHSEGSLISIIASQRNSNINGLVSIAGAGTSADTIIMTQLKMQPPQVQELVKNYLDTLKGGKLLTNVPQYMYALFRPSVQPYMISWIKYNPSIEISKLNIPILILQGDSDLQVSIEDAQKLKDANSSSSFKILSSTNHVLKIVKDQTENQKSYIDSSYALNFEIAKHITEFIKNIK
jgi:pimeloyl-ACP methyl ester carboxylesterase